MKNLYTQWVLAALIAIAAGALLIPSHTVEITPPPQDPPKAEKPVLLAPLRRICSCESTGRPGNEPQHYDAAGNVLRGVINPSDVGMCQINLVYHEAAAKKLGLNLFTEEGNIEFANHLYSTQGDAPWGWSKSCWKIK